jgi:hypothetical protein
MCDMKKADSDPAFVQIIQCYQCCGGGRTRTYEGLASGFTVLPLSLFLLQILSVCRTYVACQSTRAIKTLRQFDGAPSRPFA